MHKLHPSEVARIAREDAWDRGVAQARVVPGSHAEERALALIDDARADELAERGDSLTARRKRQERWWGKHREGLRP